jgi:hypothetical protein
VPFMLLADVPVTSIPSHISSFSCDYSVGRHGDTDDVRHPEPTHAGITPLPVIRTFIILFCLLSLQCWKAW